MTETVVLPRYAVIYSEPLRRSPGLTVFYVTGRDSYDGAPLHYGSLEQCEYWLATHGYRWVEDSDDGEGYYERAA